MCYTSSWGEVGRGGERWGAAGRGGERWEEVGRRHAAPFERILPNSTPKGKKRHRYTDLTGPLPKTHTKSGFKSVCSEGIVSHCPALVSAFFNVDTENMF